MNKLLIIAALTLAAPLAACGPDVNSSTADQQASAQQEVIAKRAQAEVGIYVPTNFTRKRLANRINQMLDSPNLSTVSYSEGLDDSLSCLGPSIGFPLPGAVQTTSPQKWEPPPYFDANGGQHSSYSTSGNWRTGELVPQPEPDQLYYPGGMDATWVMLVNTKGEAEPAYIEGKVATFFPDDLPPANRVKVPCSGDEVDRKAITTDFGVK